MSPEEDKEDQREANEQEKDSKLKEGTEAGIQKDSGLGTETTKETEMNATAGDGHNQ